MADVRSQPGQSIDAWRASALGPLLAWNLVSAVTTGVLLTALAIGDPAHRRVLVAGWCIVAFLAFLTAARRLPWRLRAVLFLLANYSLVVISASSLRPGPVAFIAAPAVVVLTGLLLGGRAAFLSAAGVTATLTAAALLASSGAAQRPPLPGGAEWAAALIGSLPAIVMVVLALRSLGGRLESALSAAVRTGAELDAARQRLLEGEKAELAAKLSRALAHDLNNTLTVVMANAEWLTERLDDREAVEAASQICEAARNAATLTQYALLASRASAFQPRPIELTRTAQVAAGALRRLLPPDITVETRPSGPVWARFDPGWLQQILLSLAFNARAAMPGGGAIILAIRSAGPPARSPGAPAQPAPAAILEVSDTGLGMDAEERRRAFDALPGARFSLSSVKSMVEAGGGEVGVRSVPGAGTTFTVSLPGTAAALPPEPQRTRRARALVVEDDIRVRALVCTALAEDGHEVSEVSDGTQAMRVIEELAAIDLLVTDVVMPGVPVGEVLATFRARHPDGRILVCSAFGDEEIVHHRVDTGEYRLLPKPFSRSELLDEVHRLLASTRASEVAAPAARRVGAIA